MSWPAVQLGLTSTLSPRWMSTVIVTPGRITLPSPTSTEKER
jgi:hypothetical protein